MSEITHFSTFRHIGHENEIPRGCITAGNVSFEIVRVHLHRQTDIVQVTQASDLMCPLLGFPKGGKQHRSKNGDNRNDDQQFYKGESITLSSLDLHSSVFLLWFNRRYTEPQSDGGSKSWITVNFRSYQFLRILQYKISVFVRPGRNSRSRIEHPSPSIPLLIPRKEIGLFPYPIEFRLGDTQVPPIHQKALTPSTGARQAIRCS